MRLRANEPRTTRPLATVRILTATVIRVNIHCYDCSAPRVLLQSVGSLESPERFTLTLPPVFSPWTWNNFNLYQQSYDKGVGNENVITSVVGSNVNIRSTFTLAS